MVLADPRFLVAQPVEMLDQLEVAVQAERRIFVDRVERRQKDAVAQSHRHWKCVLWKLDSGWPRHWHMAALMSAPSLFTPNRQEIPCAPPSSRKRANRSSLKPSPTPNAGRPTSF